MVATVCTYFISRYQKAQDYWSAVTADVDGMLGGFAHVSNDDVKESTSFLNKLFQEQDVGRMRAIGMQMISIALMNRLWSRYWPCLRTVVATIVQQGRSSGRQQEIH